MLVAPQKEYFIGRLQSLRGIAAMMVLLGHGSAFLIITSLQSLHQITAGNALLVAAPLVTQPNTAVILFYVLSGYVLGLSLDREASASFASSFMAFLVRRATRLMPVVWVTVIIAAIYAASGFHQPIDGTMGWYNNAMNAEVTVAALLRNLLLLDTTFNPVLWSIQVEAVAAFFVPFAAWVAQRTTLRHDCLIVAVLLIPNLFAGAEAPVSLLYCFYIGLIIPKFVRRFPQPAIWKPSHCWLVFAALIVVDLSWHLTNSAASLKIKFALDAALTAYVIAVVLVHRTDDRLRVLDHPALVVLGTVSYSFYAFHYIVLDAVSQTVLGRLVHFDLASNAQAAAAMFLVTALTVALTTVIAAASYRWIEVPGTRLGRRWSARVPRFDRADQPRRQWVQDTIGLDAGALNVGNFASAGRQAAAGEPRPRRE